MTYRTRNIFIAVGLALIAAMLTMFYVANYKRHVRQDESTVQVYVATKDVPAGTPGRDLLKKKFITTNDVTRRTVVAGAISNTDQIDRLLLKEPLYAGEQVTVRRFSDVNAQGIQGQLKGTQRAVEIPGKPHQVLQGILRTGDHVDVVANIGKLEQPPHVSRIILRDLLVLEAPNSSATSKVDPNADATVVLAVTDTQVQRLFYVTQNADWTLQLRPVVDAADSPERAENNSTASFDGLSDAEYNRLVRGKH
jgi:Flp pilus assembly protein CpaB